MAMNPMQKKANKYLILGILGTLLITGSVIAFLFMQMNNLNTQLKTQQAKLKKIYVLGQDISSGTEVTNDMLIQKTVSSDGIPSNAISSLNDIETNADETIKVIAKINLSSGTILTSEMLEASDDKLTADQRIQEYNMIVLPSQLQTGEYVDIRLMLPTGEDYIVASKKKVEVPVIAGVDSATTIWVKMSESETLMMDSAIVDSYRMVGSVLYATRYVEAGNQTASTPTYAPTTEVTQLVQNNPNMAQEAKNALVQKFNSYRGAIQNQVNVYAEDAQDNLEKGIADQIKQSLEDRQTYLEGLGQ